MDQHLNEIIMTFKENGYQIVRNFLEPDFVKFIQQYFILRIRAGHSKLGDAQAPHSFIFYGDPLIETILENSCKSLSKISGFNLLPTYSYTRLYGCGDELKIHKDRPSCQISATLSLGFPEGSEINPIYFSSNEDGSDAEEIILNPGDLCLYRGCDLYHWRPEFTQKWYLQTFLHYVDENGEYKENIYDGRPYLGMAKEI
jgi:hypothetical protein